MQYHRIPALDRSISRLGLGTVKIGRSADVKYPQAFSIPTDQQVIELLALAADVGINCVDTAPAYGNSEQRLGKLLPKVGNDWVIVTKAGEEWDENGSRYTFTPQHIRASVERSVARLGRDALDIVLVHSNGEDQEIIEQFQVFDTLSRLRDKGLVRAFGMSAKTITGALLTLEHSDVLMYEIHPQVDTEQASRVMEYAERLGKQVLVKKAFASGHLLVEGETNNADWAIRRSLGFALSFPATASVIAGTINPAHLVQNVAIVDAIGQEQS